jgi:hypothetical protein
MLTEFENHRTVSDHENQLIAKVFIFFFIDCFLWFYLLAFVHIPFGTQIDQALQQWFGCVGEFILEFGEVDL